MCRGKCEPGLCINCDATPEERRAESNKMEERWNDYFAKWGMGLSSEKSFDNIFKGGGKCLAKNN